MEINKTSKRSRKGDGVIEIEPWDCKITSTDSETASPFTRSQVHHMYQSYPCGFRTPENCSSGVCRWIYPITYGGGLVGGDQISICASIGQKCCVLVCTQEMTKVYHCRDTDETTTQTLNYTLKPNSLLCVLPDPLVCYRDARFCQKQTFKLSPSSNLVFLDWLHAGRQALGEFWSFQRCRSTIELFFCDKLVFRDCNDLDNDGDVSVEKSMGNSQILGTCIILGAYLSTLSLAIEEKYGRKKGFGESHSEELVVSVSPLSYSVGEKFLHGCYVRFLAQDMKHAATVIKDITKPLLNDLGADPFERKI